VLRWFDREGRKDLPWQREATPYRVWVSEIMLQQTQVRTVIPYFERFVAEFPTVRALADADLERVLKAWEGLGYYSRARNLHRAARAVADRVGELPGTYEALLELPGLGTYAAAAVASIAYGEPVPAVDGNVLRVLARFWGIGDGIDRAQVRARLRERLDPIVRASDPARFNQALMELGALLCRPQSPRCEECPLRPECVAHATDRTAELPVRRRRGAVPHHDIAVGIIWRRGSVLIARRREDQMLGGLWEFPGGKRQGDERLEETAHREIREETGLSVRVGGTCCVVRHAYTHMRITLTAFHCRVISGRARARAADEIRWVRPGELVRHPFPKASLKVIDAIQRGDAALTPLETAG
jgi:A/G-specific adenine glycosylase